MKLFTEEHLRASRRMPTKLNKFGRSERKKIAEYFRAVRKEKTYRKARDIHRNQTVTSGAEARVRLKHF